MTKNKIAKLFGIKESAIDHVPGISSNNVVDTYTFMYGKAISFDTLKKVMSNIPDIKLGDSIITESKVVLRVRN